jgi:protein-disulfide isomerase
VRSHVGVGRPARAVPLRVPAQFSVETWVAQVDAHGHGEGVSKAAKRRKQPRVPASRQRKGKGPVRPPRPKRRSSRTIATSRRTLYVAVVAAAALLAAALIGFSALSGNDSESAPPPAALAVDGRETATLFAGIPQDGTALGRPDAPVTLVEFADFQCPFCRTFARDALPEIVRRYVRPGKVRMEYRALAFLGPDSVEAREMALAVAHQDRFWQFAHLLFENQGEENSGWVTEERLEATASAVPGLDVERALADRTSAAVAREAERAEQQAEQFGISGTPAFLARRTGGKLERIEIQSLDAGALTPTLDSLLEQ